MSTFKFTQAEQPLVAEIKRRVTAFKIGSNEPVDNKYLMVLLCAPSYAKSLIKKGIIVPYGHERAGHVVGTILLIKENKFSTFKFKIKCQIKMQWSL
jgi:hypothetical protein